MAATKYIAAEYSEKLDPMANYVRRYFERDLPEQERSRALKGVSDFLYRNTKAFQKTFYEKIGVAPVRNSSKKTDPALLDSFVQELTSFEGECVFLLKDTQVVLEKYQAKTGRGIGLPINRGFLCRNEGDYFALIELVYKALSSSTNTETFLEKYLVAFQELIDAEPHFRDRSKIVAEYIRARGLSNIVWVDLGFQYTFTLFCLASVKAHSKEPIKQDYYNFSAYAWLQDFFAGKYFSPNSEYVLGYELESIKEYRRVLEERAQGAILGFAIGDALGFPLAGIEKEDAKRYVELPVRGFLSNREHPYFSHLKSGNYTDNTNSLIISARHLIKNRSLNIDKYVAELIVWGKKLLKSPMRERWAGPTLMSGIRNLIEGKSYLHSGSTTTQSCSATYRVIPLGIYYRPFTNGSSDVLLKSTDTSAMITHNSDISKTGCRMVALILADLMIGISPRVAVEGALNAMEETDQNAVLLTNVREAIAYSDTETIEQARKRFGTGSPIYQTLPLAVYCFLKYQNSFEDAVLAAANSLRDDTEEEKQRLVGMSWEQQILEAKGGNVDGIAGLTGAFMGAHNGVRSIPKRFLSIESKSALLKLGTQLTRI